MAKEINGFKNGQTTSAGETGIDYLGKTVRELLAVLDEKISVLGEGDVAVAFDEIVSIKSAIEDKINKAALPERASLNGPMAYLDLYINAISLQLGMAFVDVRQFLGFYIPQMRAAVSQMAAIVG